MANKQYKYVVFGDNGDDSGQLFSTLKDAEPFLKEDMEDWEAWGPEDRGVIYKVEEKYIYKLEKKLTRV